MTCKSFPWLATLLLAVSAASWSPAQASVVLYQQAPGRGANAVANGSLDWAPRLAEVFTFAGQGQTLFWWGTASTGLNVDLWAGDQSNADFGTNGTPASVGHGAVVPVQDGTIEVDGVPVEVFRYSVSLANLAGGTYTLAIDGVDEGRTDDLIWFWLQSPQGDQRSLSGVGEKDRQFNAFDLALQVEGEPVGRTVPAPASAPLAAAALGLLVALRRRQKV